MKVLLTGAFGNVGQSTLQELVKEGHEVTCFDLPTNANKKRAGQLSEDVRVIWGDLRNARDVSGAVQEQEVVVHLAFVIPHLSVTGVNSEDQPEWAWEVNVGGMKNLLEALHKQKTPPKIVFSSSLHVYGRTQDQEPPRYANDPVQPVEHYAMHKVECELMLRSSDLQWCILRLGAALPIQMILDMGMFDVPLDNRIEFVHSRDVGLAISHAVTSREVWGKTLLLGGGERCQFYYRELMERVLDATGVGTLPEEAFTNLAYSVDWLDTEESQKILNFQQHTLDDYLSELRTKLGWRRKLIRVFRPLVRAYLLQRSPYFGNLN